VSNEQCNDLDSPESIYKLLPFSFVTSCKWAAIWPSFNIGGKYANLISVVPTAGQADETQILQVNVLVQTI